MYEKKLAAIALRNQSIPLTDLNLRIDAKQDISKLSEKIVYEGLISVGTLFEIDLSVYDLSKYNIYYALTYNSTKIWSSKANDTFFSFMSTKNTNDAIYINSSTIENFLIDNNIIKGKLSFARFILFALVGGVTIGNVNTNVIFSIKLVRKAVTIWKQL